MPYEDVIKELKEIKEAEADVGNKVFAYKYIVDPEGKMQKLQEEAIMMFAGTILYSCCIYHSFIYIEFEMYYSCLIILATVFLAEQKFIRPWSSCLITLSILFQGSTTPT